MNHDDDRRRLLKLMGGLALAAAMPPGLARAAGMGPHTRLVPASGERLPAIGMGTWITFSTLPGSRARSQRVEVLDAFFRHGGRLVDSSPMYGTAEATVGECLSRLGNAPVFSATKVWTSTHAAGRAQMERSMDLWGIERFDLMQVHNMLDWKAHLETLVRWKDEGRIRYIGITTSHGRRHDDMLRVIASRPEFDFVQFTYNIEDREAETRLLPAALDHGKAVIINRPFRRGALFTRVRNQPLPELASELGCRNWAQYFLKFIISHPAVTCAIPATSRVDHMRENMGALHGPLPDQGARARMLRDYQRLVSGRAG